MMIKLLLLNISSIANAFRRSNILNTFHLLQQQQQTLNHQSF